MNYYLYGRPVHVETSLNLEGMDRIVSGYYEDTEEILTDKEILHLNGKYADELDELNQGL